MYKNFFKRILDFFVAFTGFIILFPLFLIVSVLLLFVNRGNPFFLQRRPGKDQNIFKIIKFKTMNDKKDEKGNLLPDKYRITAIGSIVRKLSLDEIPQLLNVLLGDMSLVGPRPLLVNYLPYYTQREQLRHTIRPGITGLAQVNGRNTLNWDERLEMDAKYVENISFGGDIKIILKTIKNVLKRKDVVVVPGELFTTLDDYRSKNGNKS